MKEKILALLRSKEGYCSGEYIGHELGVSRTAVWKWLDKLTKDGYVIEGKPKQGYKLIECPDKLYSYEVNPALNSKWLGKQYEYYELVDTTNNVVRAAGEKGMPHGTVVLGEEQTGGKGRKMRGWYSPSGEGLWFSMLLRPNIHPSTAYMNTLVAAVGVVRGVRKALGIDLGIKWPNDIFYHDKKLAGILTEMRGDMDTVHYIVVGIGVDVNILEFPDYLKDIATSLCQITGKKVDRLKLFIALIESLEEVFDEFFQYGFSRFRQEWEDNSIIMNRAVRIESFDEVFDGVALGIDDNGRLLVEKENGTIEKIIVGDVSLRLKK